MMPKEVLKFAREHGAKVVDLKFIDVPGVWQHFSIPFSELSEETFEDGVGFDGSSIRGFQHIHESDMLAVPDPQTAVMDPFCQIPTLTLICNIADPVTKERYRRDPRYTAQKAEMYLRSTGIADTAYFGPEMEHFIFDDVRYDYKENMSFHMIDSAEAQWNTGREEKPNLGYKARFKEGYFPVPPVDTLQDIRSEIVLTFEKVGIRVEAHHHEVATAGQGEIDMRFTTLTKMADNVMWYKYIVRNVAKKHGKTATFMPKPIFADNGSGMHVHQSLWRGGETLFAGREYAGLSEAALYYIGGILHHAKALCALVAPTTNSYRRLVPGYEAPVNLAYSSRNRSAGVRIPMYFPDPRTKRVEVRFPDNACNPYFALSAMLMAGIDGIQQKIHPGLPLDKDIYEMPPEELAEVPSVPSSLAEALNHLEEDHEFLLRGDVFTEDIIETWLSYKRTKEVDAIRLRPHPYEFHLYYDL
jgi:glutamine synthetase